MKHTVRHTQLSYRGPNRILSWCWIDIYEDGGHAHVVFTEPDSGDSGMSITNAAEAVILTAQERYRLPSKVSWYERYIFPEGSTLDEITLDAMGRPQWHRVLTPPWGE